MYEVTDFSRIHLKLPPKLIAKDHTFMFFESTHAVKNVKEKHQQPLNGVWTEEKLHRHAK